MGSKACESPSRRDFTQNKAVETKPPTTCTSGATVVPNMLFSSSIIVLKQLHICFSSLKLLPSMCTSLTPHSF